MKRRADGEQTLATDAWPPARAGRDHTCHGRLALPGRAGGRARKCGGGSGTAGRPPGTTAAC